MIVNRTSDSQERMIPRPKEADDFCILIQKIPGVDVNKFAIWRDKKTISLVDFESDEIYPFAYVKYDTSYACK